MDKFKVQGRLFPNAVMGTHVVDWIVYNLNLSRSDAVALATSMFSLKYITSLNSPDFQDSPEALFSLQQ